MANINSNPTGKSMKKQLVYVPPAEGAKEIFKEEAIAACSTPDGHFFVSAEGVGHAAIFAATRSGMGLGPILPGVLDQVDKPKP
jgi:hypothetical protein